MADNVVGRGAAVEMVPMRSSKALESAGYEPASRTLRVRFRHGGVYDYAGVPPEVYDGLLADPHPWTHWGARIKSYPCSRV